MQGEATQTINTNNQHVDKQRREATQTHVQLRLELSIFPPPPHARHRDFILHLFSKMFPTTRMEVRVYVCSFEDLLYSHHLFCPLSPPTRFALLILVLFLVCFLLLALATSYFLHQLSPTLSLQHSPNQVSRSMNLNPVQV